MNDVSALSQIPLDHFSAIQCVDSLNIPTNNDSWEYSTEMRKNQQSAYTAKNWTDNSLTVRGILNIASGLFNRSVVDLAQLKSITEELFVNPEIIPVVEVDIVAELRDGHKSFTKNNMLRPNRN